MRGLRPGLGPFSLKEKLPNPDILTSSPRAKALLIDKSIVAAQVEQAIKQEVGSLLTDLVLFDVYQGKGIPEHQKSMALGLTLQHTDRTLTDNEVNDTFANLMSMLQREFNATLR